VINFCTGQNWVNCPENDVFGVTVWTAGKSINNPSDDSDFRWNVIMSDGTSTEQQIGYDRWWYWQPSFNGNLNRYCIAICGMMTTAA